MKKFCLAITAIVMALAMTSCGSIADAAGENVEKPVSSQAPQAAPGKISLGGSTSLEKVIGALSEAYMNENTSTSITYDPTGSGAGIISAKDGTVDIGLSSRELKADETGLKSIPFALDGIAIVVNTANPVEDITIEQLAKIATGEIKNWKELGGSDSEIVFLGREAGSGTRDGFETIVDVKDKCVYSEELTATGAIVGKTAANASAIGYASLASVGDTVKALKINGIVPSEDTVLNGEYAISRPFVLVINESKALSADAQKFVDYVQSPEVGEIIKNAGAVPMTK